VLRGAGWPVLVLLPALLAACGSGGATPSSDARLHAAGATLLTQLSSYQGTAQACARKPKPVVCLEAADRQLGGQVHDYANLLATGRGFHASTATLDATRNSAQTLANSLEILGDAQPTQANYDQVRNTFDVNAAVTQLRRAVDTLDTQTGG
jgi:hypothetical protein